MHFVARLVLSLILPCTARIVLGQRTLFRFSRRNPIAQLLLWRFLPGGTGREWLDFRLMRLLLVRATDAAGSAIEICQGLA
ncbi:MAG: hypothetical protein L0Y42_16220 [Phycisphaerales bacterium]|nr:hypothetical protein [Phycisphaerales bacterium]